MPKTGGTSIETALGMMRPWQCEDQETMFGLIQSPNLLEKMLQTAFLQHLTWAELEAIKPSYCSGNYFSFAWVRNPWDRMVSTFARKDPHMIAAAKVEGINLEKMSFVEFVEATTSFEHVHLRPQSDFIFDKSGQLQVDFIGRYENFQSDFKTLCQHLNIDVELPHKNSSVHASYKSFYNDILYQQIQRKYEIDFALLGYSQ